MPAPSAIDEYLARQGLEAPPNSGQQGDPIGEYLAQHGLEAPVNRIGAATEEPEEFDDTGFIGQAWGSLMRGFTGTLASLPEAMGLWAYNMQRKYSGGVDGQTPEEWSGLYKIGQGIRWVGEAVSPEESVQYRRSFVATDVPQGIGTVLGFIVGTKGVGGAIRGTTAKATARAEARVGAEMIKRGVAPATAAATMAGRKELTKKAVQSSMAAEAKMAEIMGTTTTGISMSAMEGWADAYGTLLARAKAEGRDRLTNEELDKAWATAKWQGLIAGPTEALGATAMALRLFKNLDRTTHGSWGRGLRYIVRQSARGAGAEALQESFQSTWLNLTAAHIVKYDENREAFEGVLRAGAAGGVVGGLFGAVVGAVNRKANLMAQIRELDEKAADLEASGSPESAAEIRKEIEVLVGELGLGTEETAVESLAEELAAVEREAERTEAGEAGKPAVDIRDSFAAGEEVGAEAVAAEVKPPTWQDFYNALPEGHVGRKAVDRVEGDENKLRVAREWVTRRRAELVEAKRGKGDAEWQEKQRLEALLHQDKFARNLDKAKSPIQVLAALASLESGRPISDSDLQIIYDERGIGGVERYLQRRGIENTQSLFDRSGLQSETTAKPETTTAPKAGDSITVYMLDGEAVAATVEAVAAKTGTVKVTMPDGRSEILDQGDVRSRNVADSSFVLNEIKGGKAVGEMTDNELDAAGRKLEAQDDVLSETSRKTAKGRSIRADINAIIFELQRRREAARESARGEPTASPFVAGQRVAHKTLGEGEVSRDMGDGTTEVRFTEKGGSSFVVDVAHDELSAVKKKTPKGRTMAAPEDDVLTWMEAGGYSISVPPRSVKLKHGGRRAGKLATGHAHDQIERVLQVKDPGKSKWGTRVADGKGELDQVVDMYNRTHNTSLTEDEFLDKVAAAITARRNKGKVKSAEEKELDTLAQFHEEIRDGEGKAAKEPVATDELKVGDEFTLNGERFEVIAYDPDSDVFTVQDGQKFGRQQLRDEGAIMVDKGSLESDGEVDFDPFAGEEMGATHEQGGTTFVDNGAGLDQADTQAVIKAVASAMNKAMKKLGLAVGTFKVRLERGTFPSGKSGMAAGATDGANDTIIIDVEQFAPHLKRHPDLNLAVALNEEGNHLVYNQALHALWVKEGRPGEFLAWRRQRLQEVAAEMTEAERLAVVKAYEVKMKLADSQLSDELLVMEYVRMVMQKKQMKVITEETAGFNKSRTAQFMADILAYLKQLVTDGATGSIAQQAKLGEKQLARMQKAQEQAQQRADKKAKLKGGTVESIDPDAVVAEKQEEIRQRAGDAAEASRQRTAQAAGKAATATELADEQGAKIEAAAQKAVNSVTSDKQLREDLIGPAREKLARKINEGKVDPANEAQLVRAAKSAVLDVIRAEKAAKRGGGQRGVSLEAEPDEGGATLGEQVADEGAAATSAEAEAADRRRLIAEALATLTAEERQLVADVENEVSVRDGAEFIGVVENTYRDRQRLALMKAREAFHEKGIDSSAAFAPTPDGEVVDPIFQRLQEGDPAAVDEMLREVMFTKAGKPRANPNEVVVAVLLQMKLGKSWEAAWDIAVPELKVKRTEGTEGELPFAPMPDGGLNPEQRAEVEAQKEAVPRIRNEQGELLGPNGEVSNLSEADWVTVRTPFFRRWFGDWLAVAEQLRVDRFIERALAPGNWGGAMTLRELTDEEVEAVKELTGVDAGGLSHELNANWLRHGYRQHKSDAEPTTVEDLKRIPEVLDGWDYVELGSPKNGHPSVRFVKRVNGSLYVVERIFKGSRKSEPRLTQITMWKEPSTRSPAASSKKPRQRYARSAGKARGNLLFINGRVNPDSVSKAVDKNGEPRVVWHGGAKGITEFDIPNNRYKVGLFAASERATAESFAEWKRGEVYPLFYRITDPLTVEGEGNRYSQIPVPSHLREFVFEGMETIDTDNVAEIASEQGHDGAVIKDVFEGTLNTVEGDVFVVFDPNQAKRTDNLGTFDDTGRMSFAPTPDMEAAPDNRSFRSEQPVVPMVNGGVTRGAGVVEWSFAPAFHGTPHEVDAFRTEKIGTGEGGAAFGWGLYFTETEGVAEGYRRRLTPVPRIPPEIVDLLDKADLLGFESEREAMQAIRRDSDWVETWDVRPRRLADGREIDGLSEAEIDAINEYVAKPLPRGNVYSVELDVAEDELLLWDVPLSEQPKMLIRLREVEPFSEIPVAEWGRFIRAEGRLHKEITAPMRWNGSVLYRNLSELKGKRRENVPPYAAPAWRESKNPDPRAASMLLKSIGIKGIKYLDGDSRSRGEGSYNYVIFDESRITITGRNGEAVAKEEALSFAPSPDMEVIENYIDSLGLEGHDATRAARELQEQFKQIEGADKADYSEGFGRADDLSRRGVLRGETDLSGDSIAEAGDTSIPGESAGEYLTQAESFAESDRVSVLVHDLVEDKIPSFDIVGAQLSNSADLATLLLPLRSPYFESLKVAVLDDRNRVVASRVVSVGGLGEAIADPKAMLRVFSQLKGKGKRVYMAHNHPSGDPTPSRADHTMTSNWRRLAERAGFEVVDHVITNGRKYYSFNSLTVEDIPGGRLAAWERVPIEGTRQVSTENDLAAIANELRQANPDHGHIIYLGTKRRITAVERIPLSQMFSDRLGERLLAALGEEQVSAVALDVPVADATVSAFDALHRATDALHGTGVKVLDVAFGDNSDTLKGKHLIQEDALPFAPTPDPDLDIDADAVTAGTVSKAQVDMIVGNEDPSTPVGPIRLDKDKVGRWIADNIARSATDVLRRIGLSGLAERVDLYIENRRVFRGKLGVGYFAWRQKYTKKEQMAAEKELNEFMAAREDYGHGEEVYALAQEMDEVGRKLGEAEKKGDVLGAKVLRKKYAKLKGQQEKVVKEQKAAARAKADGLLGKMSQAGRDLIEWVENTAEETGRIATEMTDPLGNKTPILVWDGHRWRKLKDLGRDHWPRTFDAVVWQALNDPTSTKKVTFQGEKMTLAEVHRRLLDSLVDSGRAKDSEAAMALLNQFVGGDTELIGGSYLANIEKARGLRLPAEFYDTSLKAYLNFVQQFSDRAAWIHAFGQTRPGHQADAFDVAIAEITRSKGNKEAKDLVREIRDALGRRHQRTQHSPAVDKLLGVFSMMTLGGSRTSFRDLYSGTLFGGELFGMGNMLRGSVEWAKAVVAVLKSAGNVLRGDMRASSTMSVHDAIAIGAIEEHFATAMYLDSQLEQESGFQKAVSFVLTVKQAADRLTRTSTIGMASAWLHTARETIAADPTSKQALRDRALLERWGFKGKLFDDLMAGEQFAKEKFLRRAVHESQFNYQLNQHPLALAGHKPIIKLFGQLQKFGFQRQRAIFNNIFKPAFKKQKVVIDGEVHEVRDVRPLMRFMVNLTAGGALAMLLFDWLWDKEDKEAEWAEINRQFSDGEQWEALLTASNKLVHNAVMIGGMGAFFDNGMVLYDSAVRGGRWRDPFTAPSVSMMENTFKMLNQMRQRGADPVGWYDEFSLFLRTRVPTVSQYFDHVFALGRHAGVDIEMVNTHNSRRDYSFLRSVARRFGREQGYEVNKFFGGSTSRDEFTSLRDDLWEALMSGDVERARAVKQEMLGAGMKRTAIASSVRGRQPIKVGSYSNKKVRREFLRWAKDRVPTAYERIERTQKTYTLTARRAGLMR